MTPHGRRIWPLLIIGVACAGDAERPTVHEKARLIETVLEPATDPPFEELLLYPLFLRRDSTGHPYSGLYSDHYTTLDTAALRMAAERLPRYSLCEIDRQRHCSYPVGMTLVRVVEFDAPRGDSVRMRFRIREHLGEGFERGNDVILTLVRAMEGAGSESWSVADRKTTLSVN